MTQLETWRDGFPRMHTVFPDGAEHENAKVVHCTPSEHDAAFASLRAMIAGNGMGRGVVRAGETFAQLFVGGTLWMSDTMDERRDHWAVKRAATGEVLIGGLGLGMVALACALKEGVTKVTVIDINPVIIAFVEPYLRAALEAAGKDPSILQIIEADLFKWRPPKGTKYDTIWFDIWPTLCTDDLAEHTQLNRAFARFRVPGGFRDCWGSSLLKRRRAQEKRQGWW